MHNVKNIIIYLCYDNLAYLSYLMTFSWLQFLICLPLEREVVEELIAYYENSTKLQNDFILRCSYKNNILCFFLTLTYIYFERPKLYLKKCNFYLQFAQAFTITMLFPFLPFMVKFLVPEVSETTLGKW